MQLLLRLNNTPVIQLNRIQQVLKLEDQEQALSEAIDFAYQFFILPEDARARVVELIITEQEAMKDEEGE